jgi:high affinity Mn2+ porin
VNVERAGLDGHIVSFFERAAREILAINQDAMQRKSDAARRSAESTTALVVGATALAVLAGLFLSVWLMARLLRPLSALAQTVRSIGEGDLDARASVTGKDEIARLGEEFNTMAERLRQYRSSSLGELLQAQQASQAAIDSSPDPVLVVDASGAVLDLNGAAEMLFRRAAGAQPSIEALDPELRTAIERVRAHVLAGRGTYVPQGFDEAVKVEGGDGPRRLLPRAAPLYSEEGAITGAAIVLQDVTRLMRFERQGRPRVLPSWALRTPVAVALMLRGSALASEPVQPDVVVEKENAQAERFSVHFQATVATQAHPSFRAPYSGRNSMQPDSESATSVVMDLFTGARLWKGGEAYFQPELSGGRGLSSTLGVAAFPSGEVYRVGDPTPAVVPARMFLRQVIGLGGGSVTVEPGPNQLAGTRDRDALTLAVGKVSIPDFVDRNPLSSDPHTQFLSWGLFASAAYDYPADTRGYTWGAAAELSVDWWSLRGGMFLEPKYANLLPMEWRIDKARGLVTELEGRYTLAGRKGAARALVFLNDARMGSYRQALSDRSAAVDVTATRAFGRTKYGFAASANQELDDRLGVFARVSWNDGANETWAFTEIDHSFAAGAVQGGVRWGRPDDEAGAAIVVSGLSPDHRAYLAAGGYGFLIGDGALRYGLEVLGEIYYRLALTREVSLGVNYQPIFNPAFNRDRGPIQVFTARAHVAF